MNTLLEALRAGRLPEAQERLASFLGSGPPPEELDLLLLEISDLDEAAPYRAPDAARALRRLLEALEARHRSTDDELHWAQKQVQHRLGLVESAQVGSDVLLAFLAERPSHLAAHHLYLQSLVDGEHYADLGYRDRFDQLRASDPDRARVLVHWARAEHASHAACGGTGPETTRRATDRVLGLLTEAKALDPELAWHEVTSVFRTPTDEGADEALASSFCGAELSALRARRFVGDS